MPGKQSVKSVAQIKIEIEKHENSAEVQNLYWNPANNRYDGADSSIFNQRLVSLLTQLKRAQEREHRERTPQQKILDFNHLRKEYLKCADKRNNPSPFHFLVSLNDRSIFEIPERQEHDSFKNLKKAAYCIEINGDVCKHSEEGFTRKCTCRPGKQDPSRKIISDDVLDDPFKRKILLVIQDGDVIDINDQQTHQEIRQAIREKKLMFFRKSESEKISEVHRFCDKVLGVKESVEKESTSSDEEESSLKVSLVEEESNKGIFPDNFKDEKEIIQQLCDNPLDVVINLGLKEFPQEFQEAITSELAVDLKKSFLPMNLHVCLQTRSSYQHLIEKITEYKISFLKDKFPDYFGSEEELGYY